MDDFISTLREWCDALENSGYIPPGEFPSIAVDFGKEITLTAMRRMIDASEHGATQVEVLTAFPLALAYLVNNVMCASGVGGNEILVERIFSSARKISLELGDGDPQKLLGRKSPIPMN